jgi:hypothetical protein
VARFPPMTTRTLALPLLIGALALGCNNEMITADAAATPDSPSVSGCGWSTEISRFQCGTNARPPMGEPNVVCTGDDCTFTDPSAMCLMETCDYATGEITLCQYSAGACPCEVMDCD